MNSDKTNFFWVWILLLFTGLSIAFVQILTDEVAESARTKDSGEPRRSAGETLATLQVKGSDHASVTIVAYTDFLCPPCQGASRTLENIIKAYPNEIQVIFKHYPSAIRPEAMLAHEASIAAAAQGKFWPMHDKLFSHRGESTPEVFTRYATELGMNLDRFSEALEDHRYRTIITHDMMEARGLGVTRAPTLFVNGRKLVGPRSFATMKQIIDQELGITQTVRAVPDQPPAPPPLPAVVEISLGQAPVRGTADAPITIVEYSDFQCPFCARAAPTMVKVMDAYPGKVRWAFKHFPLPIHPDAPLAHEVSLAAGDQGKFWEMHDLIFGNQRKIKKNHLMDYAKKLGLDLDRIEKDLASEKYKSLVKSDFLEGQKLGVRATPTFFVNGRRVVGALPFETFKGIIDQELSQAEKP